jgi:hypothetical protein
MKSLNALLAALTAIAAGGPPGDGLTADGCRFVGGEAGYLYIGHGSAAP